MASRSVSPITEARIKGTFSKLANGAASAVGTHWAFLAAISSILIWAAFGPRFHYSDTWQLVMNSWTDIFTFLVVFLIQHTQHRNSKAIHLKLDEIIRAVHGAEDELIDVEKVSDEELEQLEKRYERIRHEVRTRGSKQNQNPNAA